MKKAFSVLHPWFAAAFPILFLYAQNRNEVGPGELVLPLLIALGATALLVAGLNLLLHDLLRAGLLTTVVLLLFFSYGHLWDVFSGRAIGSAYIDKHIFLLVPYAAISFAFIALARSVRSSLKEITTILNAVALVLVAFPTYAIATSGVGSSGRERDCPPRLPQPSRRPTGAQRDIYYLVFDRYAPQETLERRFGYDNTPFVSYLKGKGFYVPEQAYANYPRTAHSLASSLNADFLACVSKDVGVSEGSLRPVYSTLQDHQVGRFLQAAGYRYFHIGSWAPFTATSSIADANFVYEASQGFGNLLYSTTLALPFGEMLGISDDERLSNAKRSRFQFRTLLELGPRPGPTFVFAHILLPHEPYLFTKDGRFMSRTEEYQRSLALNYSEQLQFTNDQIRAVVERLTSGPPETHPIIVLQSDEGPHPLRFDREGDDFDWTTASNDELADTLHIFSALYLPGVKRPGLYPTFSPVNTFRKIFDLYLGADLPLLADRTFVYRDEQHPYDFIDVTDRVHRAPQR